MTKLELIERIKTTDCAAVVAQYRPDSANPLIAVPRGQPEVVAAMLAELLHAHTTSHVLTPEHRDEAGERAANATYNRLFADAATTIMSSIQLRLSMLDRLPASTDVSLLDSLLDTSDDGCNYAIVAPSAVGVVRLVYSAFRATLLDMITETIWQTALAHVDPQIPRGAEDYATKMLTIMRSYSDARYLSTIASDRQRRRMQAQPPEETDATASDPEPNPDPDPEPTADA